MLTTCPVAALASPFARDASAGDEPDNALPDPSLDATPIGIPHCKIAGTTCHAKERKPRSIPAERKNARQNLRSRRLCAGPRAPVRRQLTLLAAHAPVRALAADAAATASAAVPCRSLSRDIAGPLAAAASDTPPADTRRCNNATANAAARTAVHTPSANSDVLVDDGLLAANRREKQNDSGPREPFTPAVQVSKRSVNFASRRFTSRLVAQSTRCAIPAIHTPRTGPGQSADLSRFQSATDSRNSLRGAKGVAAGKKAEFMEGRRMNHDPAEMFEPTA